MIIAFRGTISSSLRFNFLNGPTSSWRQRSMRLFDSWLKECNFDHSGDAIVVCKQTGLDSMPFDRLSIVCTQLSAPRNRCIALSSESQDRTSKACDDFIMAYESIPQSHNESPLHVFNLSSSLILSLIRWSHSCHFVSVFIRPSYQLLLLTRHNLIRNDDHIALRIRNFPRRATLSPWCSATTINNQLEWSQAQSRYSDDISFSCWMNSLLLIELGWQFPRDEISSSETKNVFVLCVLCCSNGEIEDGERRVALLHQSYLQY